MLRAARTRLTFANVIAFVALVLAAGGGAYAVATGSGVPDSSGVFHACVNRGSGATRVVARPSSCHKVRRRHGRVVDPGEFAIAWNQQGVQGRQGVQGQPGAPGHDGAMGRDGQTGPQGPGAISLDTQIPADDNPHTIRTVSGVVLRVVCHTGTEVDVVLEASPLSTIYIFGTRWHDGGAPISVDVSALNSYIANAGASTADINMVARTDAVGKWSRFDIGTFKGSGACNVFGLITPSS